jgi:hypothetical protein
MAEVPEGVAVVAEVAAYKEAHRDMIGVEAVVAAVLVVANL